MVYYALVCNIIDFPLLRS